MQAQQENDPVTGRVYQFKTQRVNGSRYRIENRTPYMLYFRAGSESDPARLISGSTLTCMPMANLEVQYIQDDFLSVCLAADTLQVSLPNNTKTFIKVTTVLPGEMAAEFQSNSGQQLPVSALDAGLVPATVNLTPGLPQSLFGLSGLDLGTWAGFYFTWVKPIPSSADAFVRVSVYFSPNQTNFGFYAAWEAAAGYVAIPKIARYVGIDIEMFHMNTSDGTGLDWKIDFRRVPSEIVPSSQLDLDTAAMTAGYSAGAVAALRIPTNAGRTVIRLLPTGAASVQRYLVRESGITVDVDQHLLFNNGIWHTFKLDTEAQNPIRLSNAAPSGSIAVSVWSEDRHD